MNTSLTLPRDVVWQVCDFLFKDNTTLVWDNEQQVPFAYRGNQWVGFDDERSISVKVRVLGDASGMFNTVKYGLIFPLTFLDYGDS